MCVIIFSSSYVSQYYREADQANKCIQLCLEDSFLYKVQGFHLKAQ